VLKGFGHASPLEVQVYALLERLGVPSLPVHGRSEQGLLLEDMDHSRLWRAASTADMRRAATGRAVAEWYLRLHAAGRAALRSPAGLPPGLHAWVDELTPQALSAAGTRLGLSGKPAWELAIRSVEALAAQARACPQTFNYDDFDRENLALRRTRAAALQAVVFDYDCFSLGTAFSDWRNVCYGLQGAARQAFIESYGPVSEIEQALDLPLSTLQGLLEAARRENVPGWARPLLESIENGELDRAIRAGLETAPGAA